MNKETPEGRILESSFTPERYALEGTYLGNFYSMKVIPDKEGDGASVEFRKKTPYYEKAVTIDSFDGKKITKKNMRSSFANMFTGLFGDRNPNARPKNLPTPFDTPEKLHELLREYDFAKEDGRKAEEGYLYGRLNIGAMDLRDTVNNALGKAVDPKSFESSDKTNRFLYSRDENRLEYTVKEIQENSKKAVFRTITMKANEPVPRISGFRPVVDIARKALFGIEDRFDSNDNYRKVLDRASAFAGNIRRLDKEPEGSRLPGYGEILESVKKVNRQTDKVSCLMVNGHYNGVDLMVSMENANGICTCSVRKSTPFFRKQMEIDHIDGKKITEDNMPELFAEICSGSIGNPLDLKIQIMKADATRTEKGKAAMDEYRTLFTTEAGFLMETVDNIMESASASPLRPLSYESSSKDCTADFRYSRENDTLMMTEKNYKWNPKIGDSVLKTKETEIKGSPDLESKIRNACFGQEHLLMEDMRNGHRTNEEEKIHEAQESCIKVFREALGPDNGNKPRHKDTGHNR